MSTTSKVLCTNNAVGTLDGLHSASTTTFMLNGSQGGKFPEVSDGNCFYLTVEDTLGNLEVVKVTARSTDTLTVVRAQSGTTAREWASGTEVSIRATAELLNDKVSLKEHETRWTSEKSVLNTAINAKFDKAGGAVTGNLSVAGDTTVVDLTASGDTTVVDLTASGDTTVVDLTASGNLSAGGNATVTGTITASGGMKGSTAALSGSEINLSLANCFTKTITEATTFTITNAGSCSCFTLILTNGGSATVIWPSSIKWSYGLAPTLTTTGVDVLTFISPDSGETWYGAASLLEAA